VNIDVAVEMFRSYLHAEHEEEVAVYAESDEVLAQRKINSESFMHTANGDMHSTIGRPPLTPERLAEFASGVVVTPRTLFLVAEYTHPVWGRLFAAYVSGSRPQTASSYEQLLYAAEIEGQLKIIAKYMEDFLELEAPMRWTHMQGEEVGVLGVPVATRTFVQPERERHREEWRTICQSRA